MSLPLVLDTTQAGRCLIRDEGHQCKKRIGHDGPHRAFGQEWVGSVVIRRKPKR
jgi:hypothetical protein